MNILNQLPEVMLGQWQSSGFKEPSIIQEKSFSPLIERKNVLGISPTGSGKTLAYVLPLVLNVKKDQGNQLLILAPSQELAMQITEVVRKWADLLQLKTQALIGGANVSRQIEKLKKKPEIVIGTPGRVFELIKTKKLKSHLLQTIVMDEVDQLFFDTEMNHTKQIIASAPNDFQLVFYSATADRVVEEASKMVEELVVLDVTQEDSSSGQVQHYFMTLSPRKKSEFLRSFAYTPNFSAIVFFNQVMDLGMTEEKLAYEGVPAVGLASDQNKQLRKLAIHEFAQKSAKLLLTTEVAARGLDFKAVPYVVNAEVPLSEESYIHRAGRVGRMGASGAVITFVNDATKRDYQRLMKKINHSFEEIFVYDGQFHTNRKEGIINKPVRKKEANSAVSKDNKPKKKEIKRKKSKSKGTPKKEP